MFFLDNYPAPGATLVEQFAAVLGISRATAYKDLRRVREENNENVKSLK